MTEVLQGFDIQIYVDGGSKNNQSLERMGYGSFKTFYKGQEIEMTIDKGTKDEIKTRQARINLPGKTNNEAEYITLITALNYALQIQGNTNKKLWFQFFTDSALLDGHLRGTMKCKAKNLIPLYEQSLELLETLTAQVVKVDREKIVEVLGH
jgi:ribonuclease HI